MKFALSFCAVDTFKALKIFDKLTKLGLKHIHMDFMDGIFVENFGATFEQASALIKRYPNVHFDAHVMTSEPIKLVDKLIQVGFKTIFLPSNLVDFNKFQQLVSNYPNISFGIMLEALNNPNDFKNIILESQKILVMTIDKIGGTGQPLNINLLSKIKEIKNINSNIEIYSDGGLRTNNAIEFSKNHVDVAVGGSIIFSFKGNISIFFNWWKDNFNEFSNSNDNYLK
ncbi:d-ribulose-5-phosphate 3 epimerase [Mycoplasmopsis citelli]|uniref:D-ribulose-5-phosphate 3 epimerase n=1 Tax=Mycoplasmopsis citelli TaxID=171281 RepID=A0A449B2A2_9BACT|nr:ribulose phosphate epimerase [Mycoplasmopsis citelli]VEU74675.1 d-ribulose-5-phosphate 3 epimerase [Mycoplasmopsis citelli]